MTVKLSINQDDVTHASERLRGIAPVTPLIDYPALEQEFGGRVLVKFEGAQRQGSFKFRGAFNRLVQLSPEQRRAGVVAWSSGNHAQGVAAAARLLDIEATIVMPADAPTVKMENTRALGARIVAYDRLTESREDVARGIAARSGAVIVPSFDDPDVIAGQGTVGLEILEQADALGAGLDQIVVPCGGGGLLAGIGIAVKSVRPEIGVYGVEPEGFDDHARSFLAGRRLANMPGARSICDALLALEPGELTFPINRHTTDGGLTVSDDDVRTAMAYAFTRLKLVAEPGGAVALAAVLTGKVQVASKTTVVVISGSNVDPELYGEVLAGIPDPSRAA